MCLGKLWAMGGEQIGKVFHFCIVARKKRGIMRLTLFITIVRLFHFAKMEQFLVQKVEQNIGI